MQAASRWAEVRVGQLLGPAEDAMLRGKKDPSSAVEGLNPDERYWFRRLAGNVTVVEELIGLYAAEAKEQQVKGWEVIRRWPAERA